MNENSISSINSIFIRKQTIIIILLYIKVIFLFLTVEIEKHEWKIFSLRQGTNNSFMKPWILDLNHLKASTFETEWLAGFVNSRKSPLSKINSWKHWSFSNKTLRLHWNAYEAFFTSKILIFQKILIFKWRSGDLFASQYMLFYIAW